jgi:hypothetical protein
MALVIGGINVSEDETRKALDEIFEWARQESRKKIEELKNQGIYTGGLDTTNRYLKDINAERNRRIKELQERFKLEQNQDMEE